MVGWHRGLNGHEFEQTLGDGARQGGLAYCSYREAESDTTQLLNTEQQALCQSLGTKHFINISSCIPHHSLVTEIFFFFFSEILLAPFYRLVTLGPKKSNFYENSYSS